MAKITGRDRLRYVLKQLPKDVRAELRKAILSAADETASFQRRLTPVKTGALQRSIVATPGDMDPPRYAALRSKRTDGDPYLSAIISAGNARVRYAHLVEFGTAPHINQGEFPGTANPGTPARPFFYPGFRATKKRAQNKINKAARLGIKKAIR